MTRWYRCLLILLIGILCSAGVHELLSQQAYYGAKREFRGVWIATVLNYDWPLSRAMTPQQQRDSLVVLLDEFAAARFNAVVFQIRTECDALYSSPYEPWSYWLTGTQGLAPNPLYDPLQFATEEAHKRGMELHAWFNPYRAYRGDVTYTRSPSHVTNQHPEWVITCPDGYKLLDPGLPQVRDYVATIVADVVRRYDVDGVHFDDYFYPYPEHSFVRQDSMTWAAYPRGFSWDSLAFWRRDNVNLLVHQVFDSIQAIKGFVKFGVSPFGIWKSGVPLGISGLSAYDQIYCDATAWLQGQYVDYIVPQLYWGFGGGQDYGSLQPWWASQRNGRHFFTGNATYRIEFSGWPATEITNQIRFNQTSGNPQGSVQFRAYNLRSNDGGIVDLLKSDVFRNPSLVPEMAWKGGAAPDDPQNLQMIFSSSEGAYELHWDPSQEGPTIGDTAIRYVVYRFLTPSYVPADLENPRHLLTLTGTTTTIPPVRIDSSSVQYYYVVTALSRNNSESGPSNLVTTAAPLAAPVLLLPANGEQHYTRNAPLTWHRPSGATMFRFQLDSTGAFLSGGMMLNVLTPDTFVIPGILKTQKAYFWRVLAGSQAGESPASAVWSFQGGWPVPPTLIYPVNVQNIPRNPTFRWQNVGGTSHHVRVIDYVTRLAVLDTTVTDTTFASSRVFAASTIHLWTVTALNANGESDLSAEGRFRTGTTISAVGEDQSLPEHFALEQNFPNPFNPATTIGFTIGGVAALSGAFSSGVEGPAADKVRLVVYDILGREVAVLVNERKPAGSYEVRFDGSGCSSGVYIYRLTAGQYVESRTMVLIK